MRRLNSKTDSDKKRKRNAYIVGGIFILIIILSTLGYAFSSSGGSSPSTSTDNIKYNNIEFSYTNGYWTSNINDVNYIFRFNPKQTQSVIYEKTPLNPLNDYLNKPLYYSTEDDIALADIATNLNPYVQRLQEACFDESNCTDDLIVKTCSDNFIIIKVSDTNSIKQEQNCLYIEGKSEDLAMLSDEALFNILSIK